jgi:hypothetical protein
MNTINMGQRLGAIAAAASITFSIVWSLSVYAYGEPPAFLPWLVAKPAPLKACS